MKFIWTGSTDRSPIYIREPVGTSRSGTYICFPNTHTRMENELLEGSEAEVVNWTWLMMLQSLFWHQFASRNPLMRGGGWASGVIRLLIEGRQSVTWLQLTRLFIKAPDKHITPTWEGVGGGRFWGGRFWGRSWGLVQRHDQPFKFVSVTCLFYFNLIWKPSFRLHVGCFVCVAICNRDLLLTCKKYVEPVRVHISDAKKCICYKMIPFTNVSIFLYIYTGVESSCGFGPELVDRWFTFWYKIKKKSCTIITIFASLRWWAI